MTIREIIEARAREAADIIGWDPAKSAQHIERAIIAILTDPQVGYKEALEVVDGGIVSDEGCDACIACLGDHDDFKANPDCPCPCHTAEAKLKELEELK